MWVKIKCTDNHKIWMIRILINQMTSHICVKLCTSLQCNILQKLFWGNQQGSILLYSCIGIHKRNINIPMVIEYLHGNCF